MMNNKYKIVCIMGEAGSGKDTLLKKVLAARKDSLNEIVSCTTRPPREGEKNGVNYYFYTVDEFTDKVKNNEMLEYTAFNNWLYGTSYDALSKEKVNIGVFNPSGIKNIQSKNNIETYVFWIQSKPKTRLLRQLNRETEPNVNEIIRRFGADEQDFNHINFRYIEIPNEEGSVNLCEAAYKIVQYLDKIL